MPTGKSQVQHGFLEAQRYKKKVHFATLMDICHLKKCGVRTNKLQKYKGRVVLRGDIVKDETGAYAVFIEQGSSASQMTAADVMDVIARFPDCDGQAVNTVSAYTQVKWRTLPDCSKFQSQNVQTYGYVFHDKWPNSWANIENLVGTSRTKFIWTPISWIVKRKTIRGSSIGTWMGKSTESGMSISSSKAVDRNTSHVIFSCTVRTLNDVLHNIGSRTCLCASHHIHGHP